MCSLHLYYWEDMNIFIDESGEVVYDIFTVITPQDLFLFHKNHEYNEFPMLGGNNENRFFEVTCKIIVVPTEISGDRIYWMPDIDVEAFLHCFTNVRGASYARH